MIDHWFWTMLAIACIVWYSTVTVYVAIRGSFDILGMLARLKQDFGDEDSERQSPSGSPPLDRE